MRTIRAKVIETLIVEKVIEIEVSDELAKKVDDGDYDEIETRFRNKAYEVTIADSFEDHGWEGVDTLDVTVLIEGAK